MIGELRTKDGKPSLENLRGHRIEATIERWIGRPGRDFRKVRTTYIGDVVREYLPGSSVMFIQILLGRNARRTRRYISTHQLVAVRVLDLEDDLPKICTACGELLDEKHGETD